jgi:hypothetical protein
MRKMILSVLCSTALASGGVHAAISSRSAPLIGIAHTPSLPKDSDRDVARRSLASILRVNNVRLEAPPPETPTPSTLLKFEILNDAAVAITDLAIEVAVLDKPHAQDKVTVPRVIVGPFTIRGHVAIQAGYTLNYQLLLKNLSSDCDCVANVSVVSARPVLEPSS